MLSKGLVRGIGIAALLWNAIGVANYLAYVGAIGEGGPPAGGAEMPAFVTAAFAIGVFAGIAGAAGLALLRRWARPLLWLSLVGSIVDWAWVFAYSEAESLAIGISVLVVAVGLVILAEAAQRRALLA